MNFLHVILYLFPLAAWGIDRHEIDAMLTTTATSQTSAYLVARNAIVNLGTNALPMLVRAGTDESACWQHRLVARICYEHIVRGGEIDALRQYDWRAHSGYNANWEKDMVGPGGRMTTLAVQHFAKVGLWYYYMESTWKMTGELGQSSLQNINHYWPRWCRLAVCGLPDRDDVLSPAISARLGRNGDARALRQPEETFMRLAMLDRLERDPSLEAPDAVELYRELIEAKRPEALPVLVGCWDAFAKRDVIGRDNFASILTFADSRTADLLTRFLADHPALSVLKSKLAEVRARPAATALPEPAFRLGTNLVVVTP